VAALVALPAVGIAGFSPVFWAIVVALPVGKLIGITGGAVIARSLAGRKQLGNLLSLGDIVAVAGLGGVGFTVSLLMNELAYRNAPVVAVEGTLAVLVASVVAGVIGVLLVVARARHYRTARSS
jgi:NhaA family Na+:H+ antiporter